MVVCERRATISIRRLGEIEENLPRLALYLIRATTLARPLHSESMSSSLPWQIDARYIRLDAVPARPRPLAFLILLATQGAALLDEFGCAGDVDALLVPQQAARTYLTTCAFLAVAPAGETCQLDPALGSGDVDTGVGLDGSIGGR
jgi:hypothetical protein